MDEIESAEVLPGLRLRGIRRHRTDPAGTGVAGELARRAAIGWIIARTSLPKCNRDSSSPGEPVVLESGELWPSMQGRRGARDPMDA